MADSLSHIYNFRTPVEKVSPAAGEGTFCDRTLNRPLRNTAAEAGIRLSAGIPAPLQARERAGARNREGLTYSYTGVTVLMCH